MGESSEAMYFSQKVKFQKAVDEYEFDVVISEKEVSSFFEVEATKYVKEVSALKKSLGQQPDVVLVINLNV